MKSKLRDTFRELAAKNLKAARLAQDPPLTQEAVGQLFNPPIERAAVAQWEAPSNGTLPTLDKLVVLSQFYGIPIDELVFGRESPVRRQMKVEVLLALVTTLTETISQEGFPGKSQGSSGLALRPRNRRSHHLARGKPRRP